jgi:predicted nuclease of restriction endonuclease-like (RecB) superfamily
MKNDPAVLATPDYRRFIEDLKARVTAARISAARHVNRDMILLYWDIGKAIVEKQKTLGWGDSVVEVVAADLRRAFPGARGFSANNVWLMRQFFSEYSSAEFLEQAVQEILPTVPWGHHVEIVKKVKAPAARLWYLEATARLGWSRNVLLNQIKAGAYERARTERKTHNFELALPEHLAEQADEMLKSSYNLEFLGIRRAVTERALEDRLIERLRDFILKLGYGFCFIGRQHRLTLCKKEYSIDLLFYHRFLKALMAFELKVGPFEPEYAGKMDFYLNLLNDKERGPGDQPSIGVATYALQSRLPAEMKGKLPAARQLKAVVRSVLPEGRGEGNGQH